MQSLGIEPIAGLLIFLACIVVFNLLLNKILLKFASNVGVRNRDESVVRWSQQKPSLGGITFYITFLIAAFSFSVFVDTNHFFLNKEVLGLLAACSLAFMLGLSDDAYDTRPLLKFSLQLACGLILTFSGTHISLFESEIMNHLLTVIWIVGIMNSLNMLDNMDAITAVASVLILIAILISALSFGEVNAFHLFLIIGTIGSLIAFLYYNWNPSKIYMGDTGSQFLGVLVGCLGIYYLWNNKSATSNLEDTSKQIALVAITFIIPIADTLTVIINRLRKGQSPFIGGKDHTTHHLSYLGLNDRKVAMVFGFIGIASVILVTAITFWIEEWTLIHFVCFSLFFVTVFSILLGITKVKPKTTKEDKSEVLVFKEAKQLHDKANSAVKASQTT